MDIKNKLTLICSLGISLFLSGCLPMQKTTQCGKDEAFNATSRKCLPVIGSASTNTVFIKSKTPSNSYNASVNSTTVTHSVAVSDVYNYGYTVKWFVHYSSGGGSQTSNMVSSNSLSYNFNPATQFGAGDYIIEAVLYDQQGSSTLDAVSWNVKLINLTAPTLTSPSPSWGSVSYSTNVTSQAININLNNPDGLSGIATWLVNGVTVATPNFNSGTSGFSHTINPQALGLGTHTVEMRIADASNVMYDSNIWIVNVVNPDLPVFGSADPGYNHTILAINGQSYLSANGGFFYDHDSDNSSTTPLENIATKTQSGGTPGICVTVDNWDKNNDGVADVTLVFDVNGSQQGAQIDLTSNSYCIGSALATQILANSEIGESKNLNVTSYQYGTTNLLEKKAWALNVMPKNSAPIIQISSNTDTSLGCVQNSLVYHTNCSADQSIDNNLDGDYADMGLGDVDNVVKLAIDVTQDFETDYNNDSSTYGEDQNAVRFQIKKAGVVGASYQDMDLTSDHTKANCYTAAGSPKASITDTSVPTGAATTYFCNLSLDAFNSNGPIEPGDYLVRAFVTDAGSVWGGIPKDSNSVTWEISVNERQSAPEVQNQDFLASVPAANESYITSSSNGSGCADSGNVLYNGNSIQEGEHVILHTIVRDLERDDLTFSVKMENLVAGAGSYSTVSSLQTIARSDDAEYYEIQTCFKVPEWANTSGQAAVGIRVTATDAPHSAAPLAGGNIGNEFYLNVDNYNPPPTFADYASVENIRDLSEDSSGNPEPTYVFSGFPFTITPPAYTDASAFDGKNVTWQWQISVNAGAWEDIPNANGENQSFETLIWTPDPSIGSGALIDLRICLGDDGDGNPADCSGDPESRKTYTNIVANPSSIIANASGAISSGNELASWTDATTGFHYVAYAAGTDIHVEKLGNDDQGNWTSVHSISFESENPADGLVPTAVYDFSMTGEDEEALLIAYKVYENFTSNPVIRIRRIDISNDKLRFNYTGLFDDAETSDDDLVVGLAQAGPQASITNTSFTENGNGQLSIEFTGIPNGTISFRLADGGAQVDLDYGVEFCNPACANTSVTATELANAINVHPRLSQEFFATVNTNKVLVDGPPDDDYKDLNSELAVFLGNITIQDNIWYVAFADASNAGRATMIKGGDPADDFLDVITPPASQFINTKTSVSELKLAPHGASNLALMATANGNLHAYLLNPSLSVTNSSLDVFDLTGFAEIKNISLSVGSGDNIFVAGVSETSSGDTYLNSAVFSSNLASVSSTSMFTGTTNYLAELGIDKVAIAANPTNAGEGVIALTTNSQHGSIPNQAHFVQIWQNTGDFSDPIYFYDYQIASSQSSPKANINSSLDGGGIALSPILNLTKGHKDESDNPASDNDQPSVFFSFHEVNGSAEIRTGIYNISSENMSTDDENVSGSYPAFISN